MKNLLQLLSSIWGFMSGWTHILHGGKKNKDFIGHGYVGKGHYRDGKKDQHTETFKRKAAIEKKRKRKQRQLSQRINRKRASGKCSWKPKSA